MERLHEEHAAALWGFCLHLTGGDRHRAEDLVQETLLRACRHFSTYDVGAGLGAVLALHRGAQPADRRVAQPPARTWSTPSPSRPSGADPVDHTDQLLQSWVVAEALSRLSEDHRAVLRECYYGAARSRRPPADLEIPEGTVKSRTHYALHALRQALEELGVGG